MKHVVTIPAQYKSTVDKVNQFVPGSIFKSVAFPIERYQFTKHSLQLFVKPWRDKAYVYCLACKYNELPADQYHQLYKSGKQLNATFLREGMDSFNVVIADNEMTDDSW